MPTIEITQEQIKGILRAVAILIHDRGENVETLFDIVATTSPDAIDKLTSDFRSMLNLGSDSKLLCAHKAIESFVIEQSALPVITQLSDYEIVFNHWVAVMGKDANKVKLTKKRKDKMRRCFKDGYTVEDMIGAIDGCAKSRFHMGENSNGNTHNDLELILRDGTNLERFRDTIGVVNGPLISNGAPVGNRSSKEIGAMEIAIDRSWAD